MAKKNNTGFFWEFLKSPGATGAVAPSSPFLAEKIVSWVDWNKVKTVVELGPGTGAFTETILSRLEKDSKYVAIEINPNMCKAFKERFPHIQICHDSVKNIGSVCKSFQVESVECVICGLPWAAFKEQDQIDYLEAITEALSPGGHFATFAYLQGLLLPAGRRFKKLLDQHFSTVEKSSTVWLNAPPAFVYRCKK